MTKKPAPTAEEQPLELPPPVVIDGDIEDAMEMIQDDFRASELAIYLAAKRERDTALRSNREKDAQLKQLHELWGFQVDRTIERDKALAEKDARIAELEARFKKAMENLRGSEDSRAKMRTEINTLRGKLEDSESKLRAVSDALEEPLTPKDDVSYYRASVDSLFSRIRAIVEGK